jgi:hypothetical protein
MGNQANLKVFSNQLESFKVKTIQRLDIAKQEIAKEIFTRVITRSPVDTGSFCLSNKVGIGVIDHSKVFKTVPALNATAIKAEALAAGVAKIMSSGSADTIYISNSIPHALIVEKLGWKNTPAYFVYGLSLAGVRVKLPQIIKRVEAMKL